MAEAIVDGSPIPRFFCHECSREIEHPLDDYKCPICEGGFIEELENTGNGGDSSMDVSNEDLNYYDLDDTHNLCPEEMDTSIGLRANGSPQLRSNVRGCTRRIRRNRDVESRTRGRQPQPQPQIEHLIQDIIVNMASVGGGITFQQGGQQSLLNVGLFLGNPGDYVWSRDGLDAIVTQLLHQMDGTGPPPLPKKQIDEIPTIAVSQTQVDCKLQCSVCWEDFILSEPVRQLPCQHFYHAPCIVPWLELHGTCPICRQSLGEQNTSEANQDTVGPSLAALFSAANQPSSSRTSSASSTSTGSHSRTNSSNEI